MHKVGVVGAGGRMGQEVCRAVAEAPDLELVAAVDPAHVGRGRLRAGRSWARCYALADLGAEVVVDFTVAAAVRHNLPHYAQLGIHAVVGTTGLTDADLADVRGPLRGQRRQRHRGGQLRHRGRAAHALLPLAAPHMDGVEVIELHHDAKRDAPSGTAMHTAAGIAAARRAAGAGPLPPDPTTELVLAGARGAPRAPAASACTRCGCPAWSPTKR